MDCSIELSVAGSVAGDVVLLSSEAVELRHADGELHRGLKAKLVADAQAAGSPSAVDHSASHKCTNVPFRS